MPTTSPILWVIDSLGVGGAEQLLVNLVIPLRARGFPVTVAHLYPTEDLAPALREHGADVVWLGAKTRAGLPRAVVRLMRLARDVQPALVHAHLFDSSMVTRACRGVMRTPLLQTYHNLSYAYDEQTRGRTSPRERLDRLTRSRVDGVVAVSEAVAADCRARFGVEPRVIHNGIDMRALADAQGGTGLWDGTPKATTRVVSIGRIERRKGQDIAGDAVRLLRAEGRDLELVLVGGAHDPEVLRHALGQDEGEGQDEGKRGVRFVGLRDDVPAILAEAHIMLNTSRTEGLPLTVLEAMAAGRPIVATRVGGVGELITHEESGLLVEPGEPQVVARAVAQALRTLLDDPARATAMGQRAQATARERFSADGCADQYADEYARLIEAHAP